MVRNVIHLEVFINNLTDALSAEGADTEEIGRNAINSLQHSKLKIDTFVMNSPLNLRQIEELNIQDRTKSELSKLITQLFIGSFCPLAQKERLDRSIARLFSQRAQFHLTERVERTSSFLIRHQHRVEEPLIERFLQDDALVQLLEKLPPAEPNIQEVVEIYDLFRGAHLGNYLRDIIDLFPNLNRQLLIDITHLLGLKLAHETSFAQKCIQFINTRIRAQAIEADPNLDEILNVVREIPEEQRENAIVKATPLLRGISHGHEKATIVSFISKIPSEQRTEEFINNVAYLIQGLDRIPRSFMFKAIVEISSDQREDVIEKAIPLMEGFRDGYNRQAILKIISEILPDQRADVIAKAKPFIDDLTTGDEKAKILDTIREIPEDQREDVVTKAAPYMEGVTNAYQRAFILKAISEIPENQREYALAKLTPIMRGITYGLLRANIISAIGTIPKEQLTDDCIQNIGTLIRGLTNESYDLPELFKYIKEIPLDQRGDIIAKTALFIDSDMDRYQRQAILVSFGKIPSHKRAAVISKGASVMEGITEAYHKGAILETINLIPEEQQTVDVINNIALLMRILNKEWYVITTAIEEIPPEKRTETISKVVPLIENVASGNTRGAILKICGEIPSDQLTDDVITNLATLMARFEYSYMEQYPLVKLTRLIPPEHLKEVIHRLHNNSSLLEGNVLDNIFEDNPGLIVSSRQFVNQTIQRLLQMGEGDDTWKQAKEIINSFKKLELHREHPLFQSAELIKNINTLIGSMSSGIQRAKILEAVEEIPEEQRADVIAKAIPLMQDFNFLDDRINIIKIISKIPSNQRTNTVVNNFAELIRRTTKERRKNLLSVLAQFFAPENLADAITISRYEGESLANIMNDPTFLLSSREHLKNELERLLQEGEREKTHRLATLVVQSSHIFRLHEEHPLYQLAIEAVAITDPSITARNNPFRVYRDLKDELASTSPLSLTDQQTAEVWNLETFRKRASAKPMIFADLPQGIQLKDLVKVFTNLEERLAQLSPDENVAVQKYLSDLYNENTLPRLKNALFTTSIIPGLLGVQGKKEDPVDMTVYYLFNIVQKVLESDNRLKKNMLLTEQEEMLLKFANSIIMCPTGQKDAIALFYGSGVKKKTRGLVPASEKLEAVIDETVQTFLNNAFASRSLFIEATKQSDHTQESHQTTYMKNRLTSRWD